MTKLIVDDCNPRLHSLPGSRFCVGDHKKEERNRFFLSLSLSLPPLPFLPVYRNNSITAQRLLKPLFLTLL